MEENKISYYAIIPASVRYDESIPHGAKLLYGEITALCNEKGYCWATNDYFAKLYHCTKQTISVWVSALQKNKYIETEIIYEGGSKKILNRYIKISEYPIKKNLNTPIKKNLKDNNTSINNTVNSIMGEKPSRFSPPTLEEVKNYCLERNNSVDADRFIDYYTSNGWLVGKNKMKDWKAAVRTWERTSTQKQNNSLNSVMNDLKDWVDNGK